MTGRSNTEVQNSSSGGSMHNFSYDEHIVGTWVDGKPLYEKSLFFNNVKLGNNVYDPSQCYHGVNNLEYGFVRKDFSAFNWTDNGSGKTEWFPSNSWKNLECETNNGLLKLVGVDSSAVIIEIASSGHYFSPSTTRSYIFTICYTKTTDSPVS